jgi:glucosamine 6-phosphate synthetase-like amidotransferase/phosphosugar isomerase protein
MCGIVGIASAYSNGFSHKEAQAFMDMLYFDALRGFDSTGVFGVDKHANVAIAKEATQAAEFIHDEEIKKFKGGLISSGLFAVGHNRAATRGSVVDKNAHPFWVDDKIVLVQNGTYKGSHKHLKDTEVDTEALAHVIAENADISTALKKINAAYALVWFNTETKELYLIRNEERPLFIAKAKGTLLWCSEAGFLYMAAARHGLELDEPPRMLPVGTLVTLSIDGNNWKYSEKEIDIKYSFRQETTTTENEYDPIWGGNVFTHPRYNNRHHTQLTHHSVQPHISRRHQDNAPHYVETTIAEILLNKFDEYHIPINELANYRLVIDTWHNKNKDNHYPIEIVDYEAANSETDCKTWHVWGTFVGDQEVFGEKPVAHWFIYNKTEAEVLEYTTQEFVMGKIASVRSSTYNNKVAVICCFMTDVVPFQVPTYND